VSGTHRTPFLRALDRLAGWSNTLVHAGGVALVAAGVLGIVASALFVVAVLRAPEGAFSYAFGGFYIAASLLQGLPRWLFVCVGLAGLYFALEKAPRLVRRMALTGVVSFSLGVVLPLTLLLGQVLGSQDPYGPSSNPLFWEVLFAVFWMSSSVGIALCGVAAFWGRGLGRWRYLLLAVGVLDSPLLYSLVFVVVRGSIELPVVPYADTRWMEISLQVPVLLASVGWILVGSLLYGARDREAAIVAAEHRALSEENCSKVRRLYEVAWGAGGPATINDLVAEDILDYEHDRYGREEFKKSVADLRRTFPDLTLSVEEQTAAGDTVTTRCAFSGTDSGGVLWYPPTGKHATFSGTFTDRFSDGRLVEHRGGIGMTGLRAQLGLPRTNEKHQR
jgi:predicted ester cyclase